MSPSDLSTVTNADSTTESFACDDPGALSLFNDETTRKPQLRLRYDLVYCGRRMGIYERFTPSLTFSRISEAFFVQMKAFGLWLCLAIYSSIALISSASLRNMPRRIL